MLCCAVMWFLCGAWKWPPTFVPFGELNIAIIMRCACGQVYMYVRSVQLCLYMILYCFCDTTSIFFIILWVYTNVVGLAGILFTKIWYNLLLISYLGNCGCAKDEVDMPTQICLSIYSCGGLVVQKLFVTFSWELGMFAYADRRVTEVNLIYVCCVSVVRWIVKNKYTIRSALPLRLSLCEISLCRWTLYALLKMISLTGL